MLNGDGWWAIMFAVLILAYTADKMVDKYYVHQKEMQECKSSNPK